MSDPFISICIPTYKNVDYLKRLIDSIAIQTFKDFEVIVTDDSPDDEVKNWVNANKEVPIQYYKNQSTLGLALNWNNAILKAKGEWIKIMHDDDWFASHGALQNFADAALQTSNKFIFSACNNIYSSSGKQHNEFLTKEKKEMLEADPLNLFYLNVIGHPSTVMHKKDNAVLYDSQFSWVVDVDFYMRYLINHSGFEYIPEMLINIGINENQMSNKYHKNPKVEIPEYFNMLAKYPVKIKDNIYVFHAFWLLVRKFKMKNINEIRSAGYSGIIPGEIQTIINYQKNIPRIIIKQTPFSDYFMKKCFAKINQGLYK